MGSGSVLLIVVGGLAAFAGLALAAWYFSEQQKIKRLLRDTPAKQIADVGENEAAKVVGRTRPLFESLSAPLSGRPCVYFVVIVQEHRSSGKTSKWKTIIKEERGVPFVLEDDTGRAIVDPTAARIALDFDGYSTSGTFDDPTEAERAFLARHGEKAEGWLFNRSLRYHEAVLAEGETVAVLGEGTREPDPDAPPAAAYRGTAPTRLRLTSSREHPLVISDDPHTTG